MINSLILLAVIAWLMQILLSGWQIHRFNQAFARLYQLPCQVKQVGIGRAGGRFRARVIIAIAFDEQQRVTNSLLMKGITVLARPQKIDGIQGLHLTELQASLIFPDNQICQNALLLALKSKSGSVKP